MKISLKNFLLCAVAAVGLSFAGSASAVVIGSLEFSGRADLNPNEINTATSISNFFVGALNNTTEVDLAEGLFAPIPVGTLITANPLDFTTGAAPFLEYLTYDFNILTIFSDQSNLGFLNITGTGTITDGSTSWPAEFTLTATQSLSGSPSGFVGIAGTVEALSVPEGGSAVLLLGLGMIGVETLRRRLVKNRA